jgi:hypothetical protein
MHVKLMHCVAVRCDCNVSLYVDELCSHMDALARKSSRDLCRCVDATVQSRAAALEGQQQSGGKWKKHMLKNWTK